MSKFWRMQQAVVLIVLLGIGLIAGAEEPEGTPSLEFRKYSFDTLSSFWADAVGPPSEAVLNVYRLLSDDPRSLKTPDDQDERLILERNLSVVDEREIGLKLYLNRNEFYDSPRVKEGMSETERRELELKKNQNTLWLEDRRIAARVELSLIEHLGALRLTGPLQDNDLCKQRTEAVVMNRFIVERLVGISSSSGNIDEATEQRNRAIKERLTRLDQQASGAWAELSDSYVRVSSADDAIKMVEKLHCSKLEQGVTRLKIEQLMDEIILGTVLNEMKKSRQALSDQAKPLRDLRDGVSVDPLSGELFELEQTFTNARSNLEFIDKDLLGLESGAEPVLPKLQALNFQEHTKALIGEGKPEKQHPEISSLHDKIYELDASILDLFQTLAKVCEVIDGERCTELCEKPAKTFEERQRLDGSDSLEAQKQLYQEIISCSELVEQEVGAFDSSTSLRNRAGAFASHLDVLSARVHELLEGGP